MRNCIMRNSKLIATINFILKILLIHAKSSNSEIPGFSGHSIQDRSIPTHTGQPHITYSYIPGCGESSNYYVAPQILKPSSECNCKSYCAQQLSAHKEEDNLRLLNDQIYTNEQTLLINNANINNNNNNNIHHQNLLINSAHTNNNNFATTNNNNQHQLKQSEENKGDDYNYQDNSDSHLHKKDHNVHYKYSYSVNDHKTGDIKRHEEERKGDVVNGEYSLVEDDGNVRTVKYYADWKSGFHAKVHNSKPRQFG